jgi:hypothetical protein
VCLEEMRNTVVNCLDSPLLYNRLGCQQCPTSMHFAIQEFWLWFYLSTFSLSLFFTERGLASPCIVLNHTHSITLLINSLKRQQSLKVDFASFHTNIIALLELCAQQRRESSSYVLIHANLVLAIVFPPKLDCFCSFFWGSSVV